MLATWCEGGRLTSASLHDSQAAIPLATMTAGRVTNLYDLMDSAYDMSAEITAKSRALGHVPSADHRSASPQHAGRQRSDCGPGTGPVQGRVYARRGGAL